MIKSISRLTAIICLLCGLHFSTTVISKEVNALWVAESGGVLKVATADGSVIFEITDALNVKSVAVDMPRLRLWAANDKNILSYDFSGNLISKTPLPSSILDNQNDDDRDIIVNEMNGDVWLASKYVIAGYTSDGFLKSSQILPFEIESISLDETRQHIWVAGEKVVNSYSVIDFSLATSIIFSEDMEVKAIAYDVVLDELWIGSEKYLQRYNVDGSKIQEYSVSDKVEVLLPDALGGIWVALKYSLIYIDKNGIEAVKLAPFNQKNDKKIRSGAVNSEDQTVWVASKNQVAHFDVTGQELNRLQIANKIRDLAIFSDSSKPVITFIEPKNNAYLNSASPMFKIKASDVGTGVDAASLGLQVNDLAVVANCSDDGAIFNCQLSTLLNEAQQTVSATISDKAGNNSDKAQVTFKVDTVPPVITVINPQDGEFTNQSNLTISGTVNENVILTINDNRVSLGSNLAFTSSVVLSEGLNIFNLQAVDNASNVSMLSLGITLDSMPPVAPISSLISVTDERNGWATVTGQPGSVEGGSTVILTNTRSGATVTVKANADGSFSARIAAESGDGISVKLEDRAGNVSQTINKKIAERHGISTAYLNGRVIDNETKAPLPNIIVKARGLPSQTFTDSNGKFVLPVPGRNTWTVYFEHDDYITARRDTYSRPGGDSTVGDVVLTAWDKKAVTINASIGGSFNDSTGNVQVVIPAGALNQDITLRSTYLNSRSDFPLPLPSNLVYMGGVQMGPEHIEFNSPVTMRVKNTLQLPAGTEVPYFFASHDDDDPNEGLYDPGTGMVTEDGQFIEFQVMHFSCMALGIAPPASVGDGTGQGDDTGDDDDPCAGAGQGGSSTVNHCKGDLLLEHKMPSFYAFGENDAPVLTYHSRRASAQPVISTNIDMSGYYTQSSSVSATKVRMNIEGTQTEMYLSPSSQTIPFNFIWDRRNGRGQMLGTGSYPYLLEAANLSDTYSGSTLSDPLENGVTITGRVMVNDQSSSPLGAGWGLAELQRIVRNPDGSLLRVSGNGETTIFKPSMSSSFVGSSIQPIVSGMGDLKSVAVAPNGGLYTSSFAEGRIEHIAANGSRTLVATNIPGVKGIAAANDGTIYAGSERGGNIYVIPVGGAPQVIAQLQPIDHIDDIAIGPDGNIYILDGGFGIVYKMTPSGSFELFYNGLANGLGNGLLSNSMSMAFDRQGNLYVSNNYNAFGQVNCGVSYISKFDQIGNHSYYYVGLNAPRGIAFDNVGNLYIADIDCGNENSYSIKVVTPGGFEFELVDSIAGDTDAFGLAYDIAIQTNQLYLVRPVGDVLRTGIDVSVNDSRSYARFKSRDGEFSELIQDIDGNIVRRELDQTEYVFTPNGLHIETRLPQGRFWRYTYDANDRLLTRSNSAGHTWQFTYDANGLSSMTDPAGRIVNFTIDAAGNLIRVEEPESTVMQYTYDNVHRIISKTDSRGLTSSYQYGMYGNVTEAIAANSERRQFSAAKLRYAVTKTAANASSLSNLISIPTADIEDIYINGNGIVNRYITNKYGSSIQETDGEGNQTIIQRNAFNLPTRIDYPNSTSREFGYNEKGLLERVVDSSDLDTRYTYDQMDRLQSITGSSGPSFRFEYDSNRNITRLSQGGGQNIVEFVMTHNNFGQILSRTVNGQIWQFTYDNNGNLVTATDPLNQVTSYTYDSAGNVVRVTDTAGRETTFTYDQLGRLLTSTDPAQGVTRFTYQSACATCGTSEHLLTSITDPNGNTTRFEYDELGQLIKEVDMVGQEQIYIYDQNRNLLSVNTKNNQTIQFIYDNNDRLTTKVTPNETSTYGYDQIGNLLNASDGDGNFAFVYDDANRVSGFTASGANQVSMTLGQLFSGQRRLQLGITTPSSTRRFSYNHNQLYLIDEVRDTNSFVSFGFEYDASGRRSRLLDPALRPLDYQYDLASRLTSLSGSGYPEARTYEYDNLNRRSRERQLINQDPGVVATLDRTSASADTVLITGQVAGGSASVTVNGISMAIDTAGQISGQVPLQQGSNRLDITVTDAAGTSTTVSRFLSRQDPQLGFSIQDIYAVAPNDDVYLNESGQAAVVQNGELTRPAWLTPAADVAVDSQGQIYTLQGQQLWRYDGASNIQIADLSGFASIDDMDVGPDDLAYISTGNQIYQITNSGVASLYATLPAGVNRIWLDASAWGLVAGADVGTLYRVETDGTITVIHADLGYWGGPFAIDPLGTACFPSEGIFCRRLDGSMWFPSIFGEDFVFDTEGNLHVNRGSNVYRYDEPTRTSTAVITVGGVNTQATLTISATIVFAQSETTYAYDTRSQLVSVSRDGAVVESYQYDATGNRTLDPNGAQFVHNALNQVLQANGVTYTYDANGNRLTATDGAGTTRYTWDAENQLSRIDFVDGSYVEYAYDVFGRRIQKRLTASDGTQTLQRYVYDGEDIMGIYDGNDQPLMEFLHGPGIDEPLQVQVNGQTYRYHADALGSIVAMTDTSGNVVQRYRYDSYGNLIDIQDPSLMQPYAYTGREHDAESGLYYYRARYYDASIGRFISQDPISFAGGDVNLYRYVLSDPINLIDIDGLTGARPSRSGGRNNQQSWNSTARRGPTLRNDFHVQREQQRQERESLNRHAKRPDFLLRLRLKPNDPTLHWLAEQLEDRARKEFLDGQWDKLYKELSNRLGYCP